MSRTHRPRRFLVALGSLLLAGTLASPLGPSAPAQADHAHPPGPTFAGGDFGWGVAPVNYTFIGPLSRGAWKIRGRGSVHNENGMLALYANGGTVSATQVTGGHRVGRWEIRLRSRQYTRGHHPYQVMTELVPAGGRHQWCGARDVALESYRAGGRTVSHYIRTRPDLRFNMHRRISLHNDQWHTFAVEVTRTRISWFVDAHVISSERRKAALSGVPFAVRFTMQGVDGKKMNSSRMQMDWLRYWTLKNRNAKSVKAPRLRAGHYADSCAP